MVAYIDRHVVEWLVELGSEFFSLHVPVARVPDEEDSENSQQFHF